MGSTGEWRKGVVADTYTIWKIWTKDVVLRYGWVREKRQGKRIWAWSVCVNRLLGQCGEWFT